MRTDSYFKVSFGREQVFFFDSRDRESIDVAYREALERAAEFKREPHDISVWRMPAERGPWTPGRVNRGVTVIGEVRAPAAQRPSPDATLN